MKQYKWKFGLLAMQLLLLPQAFSQGVPTLKELCDSALTIDHTIQNNDLAIELAKIDQEKIKDAYMPRFEVDAKGGYLYSAFDLTSPAFALPSLGLALPEHSNRYQLSSGLVTANVTGSVLLYGGGAVSNMKHANQAKIQAQTVLLEKDKQEILSQVLTAYDQLGMLKEVKKVLDASEKRLGENKLTAEKAYSYGIITGYELKKIELAQSQLHSKQQEYASKRRLVLLQLHVLTHVELNRLEQLDVNLETLITEKQSSVANKPELQALGYAIEANQYKLKAAKTWWVPKIGASASLGYGGLLSGRIQSSDPMMTTGKPLDYRFHDLNIFPMVNAGIGLKWTVFDGGEGISAVKKAKIDLKIAQNNQQDAADKLDLNLQKTEIEMQLSENQLAEKEKSREIAQNALNQASEEFKVGLIKSTQLIEAETDLQQAEMEYAQAIFNQRRASAAYLKAAGNLTIEKIEK
ncbi:Outer membrane efflux protein BepC precursor [compost metagenome]